MYPINGYLRFRVQGLRVQGLGSWYKLGIVVQALGKYVIIDYLDSQRDNNLVVITLNH